MAEQSDFSAAPPLDDVSPVPIAPITDIPAIEQEQAQEDVETQKAAQPYWHPAWETVQRKFEDEIATYSPEGGAIAHQELPAEEFKITMMVNALYVERLREIMEDVKRAVEATEQQPNRPKPAKRPKSGS